jgi:RNA polymerase sigma-70 factor (ECF subfamily)
MATPDSELIAAAKSGARQALEALLGRHQGRVYRFGQKMCGDEEDAADVLQETLLAAARTLPQFREASSVSTWLYAIARSFCIKRRRTSTFAPSAVESLDQVTDRTSALADPSRSPEELASGRQLQAVLDTAISGLEPMYREVLVLRDVEGLPAAEVAQVLGLSVEAVKSRLHRARMSVREQVAPALGLGADGQPASTCRDVVELFSRRMEGEIDTASCAELEQHLQGCPVCRGRCDSLRSTLALCQRAGEARVPPAVERSVRAALEQFLRVGG